MPVSINGTNGLVFPDGSTQGTASPGRNRIINGAMAIAQRGTSSIAVDNGNWYYPVDRFSAYHSMSSGSKFSVQQNAGSVTPPPGFDYYLGATVTSAYSVTGSDWAVIRQTIEGFNCADMAFGTANAKTFTASFWVRSSLTGTMGGAFYNNDGSRSYPYTYTINAANTWEYKTITVVGDTTGTWNKTNSGGLTIEWSMGTGPTLSGTAGAWAGTFYASATGATNILATNGATLYITGVQLEKGAAASDFDFRSYGTEFDLCRRYFEIYSGGTVVEGQIPQGLAQVDGANRPEIMLFYYPKRTGPTITTSGNFQCQTMANTGIACSFAGTYVGTYTYGSNLFFSTASGVTPGTLSGVVMIIFGSSGGGSISISAEL